ncbi:hypothetical protein CEXT_327851 [Caerostris extrusa]|uniref:Uncharacterized protein n=1 Tax=Caerostris extrusa TaxID=172846 RepID=A0AAV4Y3V7_CAEEX|nr:hypothetical protein CEXT_327851 [Caerostris extrusa]
MIKRRNVMRLIPPFTLSRPRPVPCRHNSLLGAPLHLCVNPPTTPKIAIFRTESPVWNCLLKIESSSLHPPPSRHADGIFPDGGFIGRQYDISIYREIDSIEDFSMRKLW